MAVTSVIGSRVGRLRGIRVPPPFRLAVLAALLAAVAGIGGALAFDRAYEGRVLPGISVAGIDASGLTEAELRTQLAEMPLLPEAVEIETGGRRVSVTAEELGRRRDIDGAVAAALAAGRSTGPLGDVPERIGLLQNGRGIALDVSLDRAVLAAWVAARADDVRVAPRSALIVATDTGWTATTPRDGKAFDEPAAVAAIEAAVLASGGGGATARVELPVSVIAPEFDDVDASRAIAAAERMIAPLGLTFRNGLSWTIATPTLRAAVEFVDAGEGPTPIVNPSLLTAALAKPAKDVGRPADETLLLKAKNGKVFGVVPGRNGRALDSAATAAAIVGLMEERRAEAVPASASVPIVLSVHPPDITAGEAAAIAPKMTLVGAWTTRFVASERNANGANIRLPAKFINGTVVQPGAVFDFWKAVGPVTFSRGFGMGGIIEGGRTNPTGAIGGGICSASTTLFNAAARAGYQILERDQHSYYIPRYPLGLDATVSKYGGQVSQNMRFRNDTKQALFIRGLSGAGWVRFEIYSLPIGRTVTFSSPAVSNVRKAIDQTIRTADLRRGTSKRVEVPANGMDVVVFRTVRNASGGVVHRDRFVSRYIRVDGILLVGTG